MTNQPRHRTAFEADIRGVGGGVDTGGNRVVGGIFDPPAGSLDRIRGGLPQCRRWCIHQWQPGGGRNLCPDSRVAEQYLGRTSAVSESAWTPTTTRWWAKSLTEQHGR